ncbi:MAG: hypothetical protein GKR94_27580 [Gammaproteobacteria bacterium]|nr:hypothetical protein [Gammaproteobacteria bacterium]
MQAVTARCAGATVGDLAALTERLRPSAHQAELERRWPAQALQAYGEFGGWRLAVPAVYGGLESPAEYRLSVYMALARADMSAALFITQHEGATDLVCCSENNALRSRWAPKFASGQSLTTIGYSQLTTSRPGGKPALRAAAVAEGFLLDGLMPWVTGAPFTETVACGAQLAGGTQILVLLPLAREGVLIKPAETLAALNSTYTCEVHCEQVIVRNEELIAGPVHNVLAARSTLRLLLVSATGCGLAEGMLDEVQRLAERGSEDARTVLDVATQRNTDLRRRLLALAAQAAPPQSAIDALRGQLNDWLVRLAGIVMTCAKGSGYKETSTAQRLAREAQFFCVWSASPPVRANTLSHLLGTVIFS